MYFPPSESNVKPVEEEAAELATITAPTKPQTEGHHASPGEVNGFSSPSEETPPAPQSVLQDGPAVSPNTLPEEASLTVQEPLERPASLQDGQHPHKPAASSQDMMQTPPPVEAEHQPRLPTNGFSLDSTDTSILTPSSLTDLDLLEAVLDDTSRQAPEKRMPEEPATISVNVQIEESSSPTTDNVTQTSESKLVGSGSAETSDKIISHVTETVKREKSEKERPLIIVKTLVQEEVMSHKHLDTKSSDEIEGWDVPDGLQPDDLPSVSEAVSPSLKSEPKKQQSLFKRNKKKSNQGNPIHFNKDHIWNASLLICPEGRLFVLFFIPLCIFCMGYFSVYL